MRGGPGFSEGVRICDTGVVGVRNPPLMGLGATVAGVLAWLFVLSERFNFVGEIIPRFVDCNEIIELIVKLSVIIEMRKIKPVGETIQ